MIKGDQMNLMNDCTGCNSTKNHRGEKKTSECPVVHVNQVLKLRHRIQKIPANQSLQTTLTKTLAYLSEIIKVITIQDNNYFTTFVKSILRLNFIQIGHALRNFTLFCKN